MDEISRMEKILRGDPIEPITRLEIFCAMAAGTWSGDPLTPVTRLEYFLSQISGGGSGPTLSTFIRGVASYSSELHYTTASWQQLTAPENVAYDKVWISDEFCSQISYDQSRIKHFFINYIPSVDGYYKNRISLESFYVNMSGANGIYSNCFSNCSNFKDLIITKNDGVMKLQNVNAFVSTPFASGGTGGTLWVPSALISSYQSATNWSTILGYANNHIKAIEGSIWE